MTQILTHIVIDASIVLSWILDDEQDPDALFAQEYIIRGGIIMCAPDLLVTEVTNALLSAVKSRRISAENAHNLLTNFVRMPVDYSPI